MANAPQPISSLALERDMQAVTIEKPAASSEDTALFDSVVQRLEQQTQQAGPADAMAGKGPVDASFAQTMVTRMENLASEMSKNQLNVSRLVEQASSTGDQSKMLEASLALAEYMQKVDFVTRTVSKAASSVDQITRMQ